MVTGYPHAKGCSWIPILHTKINLKEIIDLNIKAKSTELLEHIRGLHLYGLSLGNSFLDMTPKH